MGGGEEYGECVSVCVSVRVERSESRASGSSRVGGGEEHSECVSDFVGSVGGGEKRVESRTGADEVRSRLQ